VTGSFEVEGMGFDLATLSARVRAELEESRWGEWRVEAASVDAEAGQGRLELETFSLRSVAGEVEGHGDLALSIDAPEGTLVFDWRLEDLSALRPLVMGEGPMDPDTLSVLERELLLFDGIEVDPAGTVPLRGSASGSARIEGRLDDLRGSVELEAADVAWADFETTLAEDGRHLPGGTAAGGHGGGGAPLPDHRHGAPGGGMTAPSWGRYAFEEIAFAGAGIPEALDVELDLRRQEGESYHTEGRVEFGPERVAYRADVLNSSWTRWRGASSALPTSPGRTGCSASPTWRWRDRGTANRSASSSTGSWTWTAPSTSGPGPRGWTWTGWRDPPAGAPSPGMPSPWSSPWGPRRNPRGRRVRWSSDLVVADVELTRVGGTLDYADEQARIHLEVEQNGPASSPPRGPTR
jgi:hypothetical protein